MAQPQPFIGLTPLEPLMDACVHCGFCLPACPSYAVLGNEADSPRGRIHLMRAGAARRIEMETGAVSHFDTCLGCMACETACPSGVRYGPLIEATRAAIESNYRRPVLDRLFRRLLFFVLPFQARLRELARPAALLPILDRWPALAARLPRHARSLLMLARALPARSKRQPLPVRTPAHGEARLHVGLVTGCVQSAFFHGINQASVRVLAAEGCDVTTPRRQGCCGALSLHAGRCDDAKWFAKRLIAAFDGTGVDHVVVNAAGCGSTMKQYGELLRHEPGWSGRASDFAARVRDISETIAGLDPPRAARHAVPARVAYHDACHLAHAQGVREEPRKVLASIPGVEVTPLAQAEMCCGSAGIFNLVQPDLAQELGRRKAACVAGAGADVVVTSNPGCLVQISASTRAAGVPARVVHLVELLDASIQNSDLTVRLKPDATGRATSG